MTPGDLVVSTDDRIALERWSRSRTAAQRVVLRSRIILLLASGASGREVAQELSVSRHTVDLWRTRYRAGGVEALARDKPGRGRKRASDDGE